MVKCCTLVSKVPGLMFSPLDITLKRGERDGPMDSMWDFSAEGLGYNCHTYGTLLSCSF